MRLEQHLILAILIGVTKSLKITRFDLLQYQYQKPLNQNQSLTVEKYLQDLQQFRHDLNFVEKAIDTGIASGATMEGLDLALGAEDSWKGMKFHERYSMGDWEGWTYEDNDGIVIYIDGPNGSIYKGRGKDITLDEAKAYLNRKGIPYGRVYRSGEWDSVQFTHPNEECYKCDDIPYWRAQIVLVLSYLVSGSRLKA